MSASVSFRQVHYRANGADVLRGIDLEVVPGETLVLLGRSGSGKTTALKMVNALLYPTSGQVLVDGVATTEWDAVRLRRRTGYVIQETGLFPHFTVSRNIGLVPRLEGWARDAIEARVRELLMRAGLPLEFASRYPRELSGGQRQRVGVARALAADPPLLLLDEPFGALDPITRSETQRYFLELTRSLGKTALFVTHDIREALKVATRIALLYQGRLALVAPPEEFVHSDVAEARAILAGL